MTSSSSSRSNTWREPSIDSGFGTCTSTSTSSSRFSSQRTHIPIWEWSTDKFYELEQFRSSEELSGKADADDAEHEDVDFFMESLKFGAQVIQQRLVKSDHKLRWDKQKKNSTPFPTTETRQSNEIQPLWQGQKGSEQEVLRALDALDEAIDHHEDHLDRNGETAQHLSKINLQRKYSSESVYDDI